MANVFFFSLPISLFSFFIIVLMAQISAYSYIAAPSIVTHRPWPMSYLILFREPNLDVAFYTTLVTSHWRPHQGFSGSQSLCSCCLTRSVFREAKEVYDPLISNPVRHITASSMDCHSIL